jgi:predicted transcriptional regulator
MILDNINFTKFYRQVSGIFSKHFFENEVTELMEYVDILSVSNFKCYKANMIVIAARKKDANDHEIVSEMEWVARSVGEYRVSSKARINKFISKVKSIKNVTESTTWASDDIVYSVGEMMDRLSIETIKREDFAKNNRPIHMTIASQKLSERVEKYLKIKLNEIDKKGFYECIHEQRTYDLEGIVKELAL